MTTTLKSECDWVQPVCPKTGEHQFVPKSTRIKQSAEGKQDDSALSKLLAYMGRDPRILALLFSGEHIVVPQNDNKQAGSVEELQTNERHDQHDEEQRPQSVWWRTLR